MSVWLSKSSQEDINLCPFAQLRVQQEDINSTRVHLNK